MTCCVLVFGLPGHGKTAFGKELASCMGAHFVNADYVRTSAISEDLRFTVEDRIKQARRMATIANIILSNSNEVVLDFVCPTQETRAALRATLEPQHKLYTLYMNKPGRPTRFPDTKSLFQEPDRNFVTHNIGEWHSVEEMQNIARNVRHDVRIRG